MRMVVTHERLIERLHYNPDTGLWTWLDCKSILPFINKRQSGKTAGCLNPNGYISIGIDGNMYLAHRLAFFYMTKSWPEFEIDHCDLIKSNNKWSNLRVATYSQNRANCKIRKSNIVGVKGVQYTKGAFQAVLSVSGKKLYLGRFTTAEQAGEAYRLAAESHYGQFSRTQ